MVDYAALLGERFCEVHPRSFYREVFPSGSLQSSRNGTKGEYPAIAVRLRESGNLRYTVIDDLGVIDELCGCNDFCVMSPCTYAGASQRKSMVHALYAIVIDLDGLKVRDGSPAGFLGLLESFGTTIPTPSHICASGTGLHLWYMLDEPFLLTPSTMDGVSEMRRILTRMIWNPGITELSEKIQYEGVTQGFRMVGTATKVGTRVRAFEVGEKVSINELHTWTKGKHLVKQSPKRERVSIDVAKKQWPEWYKKRIVEGTPRGTWRNKRALYDWWKRRVAEEGVYGHRYNCIVALAAYAKKCGIPRDELEADALELQRILNSKPAADPFREQEVRDALTAYRTGMVTYPIKEIVARTGIEIERNKRNNLKRAQHLTIARNIKATKKSLGVPFKNPEGRPKGSGTKRDAIREYAAKHPEESQRAIAKALGVSPTTVNKWLKGVR